MSLWVIVCSGQDWLVTLLGNAPGSLVPFTIIFPLITQDSLQRMSFSLIRFSRKILWLRASNTNNDPTVVAWNYVNYLREIQGQ